MGSIAGSGTRYEKHPWPETAVLKGRAALVEKSRF